MSSDEECDYMSDDFLNKCLPSKDVRPGLINSRVQQRSHEILKKKTVTDDANKQRFRPHRIVEAERREEGLSVALDQDNKGFALLQKMGYKPGSGIGKSGTGRIEPVSVNLKSGRGGLGRDSALKQIAEEKAAIRKRMLLQRGQSTSVEDYRSRMTQKAEERQMEADLYKSQRVCEQLDSEKGCPPAEVWFWPKKAEAAVEEDEEKTTLEKLCEKDSDSEDDDEAEEPEIEFKPSEKLEMLTLYLRGSYNYCLWCGAAYDDDKDLRDNCPGPTRDEH